MAHLVSFLLLMICMALLAPPHAHAHNDSCQYQGTDWRGDNWRCSWEDPNQPKDTPHWFNAVNTKRWWDAAGIYDGHLGQVNTKCVHVMRASDGARIQVACGLGSPFNSIPGNYQPGYLFTRHGANGPRAIGGVGHHIVYPDPPPV